jgi:hypothetical protein
LCTIIGDFSVSGGIESNIIGDYEPDANFTNLPFDFSETWVGAVIEDFNVHMEFDFLLTPKSPENEITIPLLFQNGVTFPQKVCVSRATSLLLLSLTVTDWRSIRPGLDL